MPALSLFDPDENRQPNRQSVFVQQVVDLYLANLAARVQVDGYDADAYSGARRELLKFAKRFQQPVESCRQHDITAWLNENPTWRATSTKKRVVNTIVAAFNWAFEEELINRCPYRRPSILRGLQDHVRRPASPTEYITLMRGRSSRSLRRALFILRRTGMRTCEMRELLWQEVFLDAIVPHICKQKHKNRRRTGRARLIGLDPSTVRFLANLRRQAERLQILHLPVFLNCDGTPWDRHTFARHLRRTAYRLGLDDDCEENVTAYCLRHTYTVDAIEGGTDAKWVADQLGHADTRMVERVYGSHTKERHEHMGNVAARISGCRKKSPQKPPAAIPGPGPGHDSPKPA